MEIRERGRWLRIFQPDDLNNSLVVSTVCDRPLSFAMVVEISKTFLKSHFRNAHKNRIFALVGRAIAMGAFILARHYCTIKQDTDVRMVLFNTGWVILSPPKYMLLSLQNTWNYAEIGRCLIISVIVFREISSLWDLFISSCLSWIQVNCRRLWCPIEIHICVQICAETSKCVECAIRINFQNTHNLSLNLNY